MPTLFMYLLQASGTMAVFYLGYISCFKRETFYSYNRILLLSAFICSAVLPLLPLPTFHWPQKALETGAPATAYFVDNANAPTQIVTAAHHWWELLTQHATTILLIIYSRSRYVADSPCTPAVEDQTTAQCRKSLCA